MQTIRFRGAPTPADAAGTPGKSQEWRQNACESAVSGFDGSGCGDYVDRL